MSIGTAPEWQHKLLTEVLLHCIGKSRAASQLPEPRRRAAVEPLISPQLQGGALDLNPIWSALLHEPGVTERALASAFAALEELGPTLQLPLTGTQRLKALTPKQRQALLGECAVNRAEVDRMVRNARIEAQLAGAKLSRSQPAVPPPTPSPPQPTSLSGSSEPLLLELAAADATPTPAPPTMAPRPVVSIPPATPVPPTPSPPSVTPPSVTPPSVTPPSVTPPPRPTGSLPALPMAGLPLRNMPSETNPRLTAALLSVPLLSGSQPAADRLPQTPEEIAAAREARVRAARALLDRAHLDMQADPRRSQLDLVRSRSSTQLPVATGLNGVVSVGDTPRKDPTGPRALPPPGGAPQRGKGGGRKPLLVGVLVVSLAGAGYLIYHFLFSDGQQRLNVANVTVLQLSEGTQRDDLGQATIRDPRWGTLSADARKEAALKAFQTLRASGVHTLILRGDDGSVQAQVADQVPGASSDKPIVLLQKGVSSKP